MTAACRQLSIYPGAPAISDADINQFIADNALAARQRITADQYTIVGSFIS